jgi:ribosomal-protein-alanine N-acetyltransferase
MSNELPSIEIRRLTPDWKQPLIVFFRILEQAGDIGFFQPHPFTDEAVEGVLRGIRRDLYYVLAIGIEVVGYGMLRGWDEGYDIPSLGIAIHPAVRGNGLGRAFMHFLEAAAKYRGADKLRLRVKSQNIPAKRLYESLGYEFSAEENGGYVVGFLELHPRTSPARSRKVCDA